MIPGESSPLPPSELRKRAERAAKASRVEQDPPADLTPEATGRLIHELRVHQIELEMQNDELRRTQELLESARARYFDLYDQAPVGYCTLSAGGLIQEANLTAAKLLGAPRGALPGLAITAFISIEDQDAHFSQFRRLHQTGTPYACDLRMRRQDRTEFWARLSVTTTRAPGAGPDGELKDFPPVRMVISDISETRRAQDATRQEQARRVEALGLLSGGIAHDFNNLLGAMLGNLELYRLGHPAEEAGEAPLSTLEELISRASLLVAQILACTGKATLIRQPLDLNRQVTEMGRLLRATLSRQIALHLKQAPGLLLMMGDPAQLQQVVLSLVLNAAEAVGPRDGTIILRTGTETIPEPSTHSPHPVEGPRAGLHVWVEVSDNGAGIPPGIQERIFDPFFTTKTAGRGLGLSTVRGIVQGHHGAIQITSQEGAGTTFRLLFPATPGAAPLEAGTHPAPSLEPSAFPCSGTILVVDDEDALRKVATATLRRMGFETLEARDGAEALQVFAAHQERISLVLMDLSMPGMDGVEASRQLRESGADVPIVLSSGFDKANLFKDIQIEAFAGFLPKPYRYQTLLETMRGALEKAQGRPGGGSAPNG